MTDFRHHRASRDVQVVLVPVPVAGPAFGRQPKPGRYPSNRREAWKPQRDIPAKPNKAERMKRFLDGVRRQEEAIREMLRPDARLLAQWVSAANF
jgi:hypothetical protein